MSTFANRDLAALLIKRVLYPLWAAKNRSGRLHYLALLEKSQYWTRTELHAHQLSSLQKLIRHAFDSCPYYRQTFRAAGVSPSDIRTLQDVRHLPVLTKEEIQEHKEEMVSSLYRKADLIPDMTGGSTGSPMQFYYDKDRLDSREAAALRHNRWASWDIGDRAALLWAASRDLATAKVVRNRLRNWILSRGLMLDASSLDECGMSRFAADLLRYRPRILLGYANTLRLFARYVIESGITGIAPTGIVSSAEVLTDEARRLIEGAFGCPVYDRYGSREFGVIASECEKHDGMHINAENLLVEVLPGAQSTDGIGEIVVTDLKNLAMPIIRYRTRDAGRLISAACTCGRGLPLLKLVGGRVTDFLVATSGSKVSGVVMATYVITNISGIRQVQFIQDRPGTITVKLVRAANWSPTTMEALIAKVRDFLGSDIQAEVDLVEDIPSPPSGKHRFAICNLHD